MLLFYHCKKTISQLMGVDAGRSSKDPENKNLSIAISVVPALRWSRRPAPGSWSSTIRPTAGSLLSQGLFFFAPARPARRRQQLLWVGESLSFVFMSSDYAISTLARRRLPAYRAPGRSRFAWRLLGCSCHPGHFLPS